MPIPALPTELLDLIFSFIKGQPRPWHTNVNPQPVPGDQGLRYSALVCKAWRASAQRALFGQCTFPPYASTEACEAWIASPARLRHPTLSIWAPGPDTFKEHLAEEMSGVQSLTIGMEGTGRYWDMFCRPSCKDLKHLGLAMAMDFYDRRNNPIPLQPLPFQLESLNLGGDPDPLFLAALFTSSQQTLHSLAIGLSSSGVSEAPSLISSLPLVAPTLRHLALNETFNGASPLSPIFPSFTSLQSFTFKYFSRSRTTAWDPCEERFGSTIAKLPQPATLRRLSLPTGDEDDLDDVVDWLDHAALSVLEVLEFPQLLRKDVTDEAAAALVATCEKRSITIVYGTGPVWGES
ncbi:hypothetical protein RQP46_002786 [Phenoliferia psychrophenolica]